MLAPLASLASSVGAVSLFLAPRTREPYLRASRSPRYRRASTRPRPFLVLIDAEGNVSVRTSGELGDDGIVAALESLAG